MDYVEIARLNVVWRNMLRRCDNSTNAQFSDYGGRGIYVSPEWYDFNVFCQWALDNGSAKGLYIDRIDNDGPYSSVNCRLVTPTVNGRNKRNNRLITAFGETKPATAWQEDVRCVVSGTTLRRRIKAGWEPEEALTIKRAKYKQSGVFSCGHPREESNVYRRSKNGYAMCKICTKQRAVDRKNNK